MVKLFWSLYPVALLLLYRQSHSCWALVGALALSLVWCVLLAAGWSLVRGAGRLLGLARFRLFA